MTESAANPAPAEEATWRAPRCRKGTWYLCRRRKGYQVPSRRQRQRSREPRATSLGPRGSALGARGFFSRGFSLVEMLAALSIFSLAAVGLIQLIGQCLRSTTTSVAYTQAVFLAQRTVEEALAEEWPTWGRDTGDYGSEFPAHTWEREVTDTDQQGLYEVRVVVRWTERGRQREYALTTLKAERQ